MLYYNILCPVFEYVEFLHIKENEKYLKNKNN